MEKSPKISIVTPSFNQGEFIEEAIKSIVDQNYSNFEHIIIDNCSTDKTLEIIAKYPHLVVVSEPDEGQSDALNKGFNLATGDIVGWLNADDYYLENTFEKVATLFNNDEKLDAIYSNVHFIDKEGNFTNDLITHRAVKWLSLFHCYIPSTTFFFNREILDNGLRIKKELHISMDKDFFANILYSDYKVSFINDFFASFRWHESNKSLESPEIRSIRYKEGLDIYNTYSKFRLGTSAMSVALYASLNRMFLVVRKLLKFQNHKYSIKELAN